MTCSDFRADLDAWLTGDLSSERAGSLGHHEHHCPPCAHELTVARAVGELLSHWRAPTPRADLKHDVLDACVRRDRAIRLSGVGETTEAAEHAPTASPSRFAGRSVRRVALAAAAAVVVTLSVAFFDRTPTVTPKDAAVAVPIEETLKRFAGDVRLRAVAHHQYPASVGRFANATPVTDRLRRSSGNVFHRSLRKALTNESGQHGK